MDRTTQLASLGTALALLLTLPACDAPVSPEAYLSQNELGRDNGTVSIEMKLEATLMWTVPGASAVDCPDLIDPATGQLFIAEGSGEGEATHMGRFQVAKLDHPTVNLCDILPPNPPLPSDDDLMRSGEFEFVAADGSTLFGTYEFFFAPPARIDEAFFTFFVEGGTHRFQGASGMLDLPPPKPRSQPVVCADPLCLTKATWENVIFRGMLTLPRP